MPGSTSPSLKDFRLSEPIQGDDETFKHACGNREPDPCQTVPPQQAQLPPPLPRRPPLSKVALSFWLLMAATPPVLVALLGVMARYLQVNTSPPFPPIRFTAVINLLALPTLLLLHTLPRCLLRLHSRRLLLRQLALQQAGSRCDASANHSSSTNSDIKGDVNGAAADLSAAATAVLEAGGMSATPPPTTGQAGGLGRYLPGLSGWHARHPAAHRWLILMLSAIFYTLIILAQNTAAGLVDPAVVMLTTTFTVVFVALLAWLWLRAPLLWAAVLPAAAVMLAGAAMLLVPGISAGSWCTREWLGFATAVGALVCNVLFIIWAQAYRDTRLSAIEVQYAVVAFNLAVTLPVSLGVDGTDWAQQFGGMDASDWGALLYCGCVAGAWIALLIQAATVRLGGTLVAMFYGLRLVVSVVASKVILGITIVETGVQIAGVTLVVLALVAYTVAEWYAARQQQR